MLSNYISKLTNVHSPLIAHNHSPAFLHCSPAYQIDQNSKNDVNFDQDLEVMEKLIEKYVTTGSLSKVFADAIPIDIHPLLGDWIALDGVETIRRRGKKELYILEESDDVDGKHGARLLLLLAYMMMSNVLDDESNMITQM